ncbi:MAG: YggS family pyridoxal phosphate-dependent enzyme [Candidatus Omnitrophota bacterium]|nr:YggS family pyridoxal phosphate-dependent enzyme [Candidatus Omnitrophota bacterium]
MVKKNAYRIRQRIIKVCSKINQDPSKITIVAVSKGRAIEQIKEAIEAGITDIGENRVQEALAKHRELSTIDYRLSIVKWHMVGHLQTNKVKDAVRIFDLIQSVDSMRLAEEINKQAGKINKIQDILIEIKTSPEESRFGLKPDESIKVITELTKFKNIKIKGLMTIAPVVDDSEKARPYFRMLRELRDKINKLSAVSCQLSALSMGMTDDFETAIEEGSNMVRLGRAIFE